MNYLQAQSEFAETVKNASAKVTAYFWKLSGDDANSLCRFLNMSEEELKDVLRLCKIYNGEKDTFSNNNFELTMSLCGCDFTTCRLKGTVERFLKIGKEGKAVLPRDMYDLGGNLSFYPVEDEHVRTLRTKSQRGSISKLVNAASQLCSDVGKPSEKQGRNKTKTVESPKDLLFLYVKELIAGAVKSGDEKISPRSLRKLHRLFVCCVDIAAKELLQASLEQYANEKEECLVADKTLLSPERVSSSSVAAGTVVTPSDVITAIGNDNDTAEMELLLDDDDLSTTTTTTTITTTTDAFLSGLKEEVLLQSLLHKRIHDRKERVFDLVHRNGRRLLVVLPPDTRSVATFEEEANRTQWIKIMLNSGERLDGMLTYLAKEFPTEYVRVGQGGSCR
jgi:hypothetical protein